jgi:hypothetical protein
MKNLRIPHKKFLLALVALFVISEEQSQASLWSGYYSLVDAQDQNELESQVDVDDSFEDALSEDQIAELQNHYLEGDVILENLNKAGLGAGGDGDKSGQDDRKNKRKFFRRLLDRFKKKKPEVKGAGASGAKGGNQ